MLGERYEEALQWSIAQVHQLHAQQRMDPPRDNITSGFYRYEFGTFRDEDGVPAELAALCRLSAIAVTQALSR